MRSSVTAFLAGALILGVLAPATAGDLGVAEVPQEESGWIVTLADGVSPNTFGSALAQFAGGQLGFVFDEVLGGFSFDGSAQAAARLRNTPFVRSVVPDQLFQLQEVPTGVTRIDGDELHALDGGAYQGQGVRVAVIDSGIDLDHPDLVQNIDAAAGINCVTPGAAPDDDNSHGTHVAGIIGASLNGAGVAGVAPQASLVAVKAFDAAGSATTAQVLCGINHVAGLVAADGIPTVANMSFADDGTDSVCDDGDTTDAVHEAICDLTDLGAIAVAAAGNNSGPAEQRIPAVFDEVISVSALTDLDGAPGGLGGCLLIFIFCDDEMAYFSNYGPSVDVIAPGDPILSTVPGGGYGEKSGTSMAAPHVAGVVAAMLSADPTLTGTAAQALLQISGECPSGAVNTGGPTCEGEVWTGDPDGIGEPLINALRAVEVTLSLGAGGNIAPIASFTSDCDELTCDFTDTTWEPDGSIATWAWDFGDGNVSSQQNPTHTYAAAGTYDVTLTVTDDAGGSGNAAGQVSVPPPPGAGEWVGLYGGDGYYLADWNGGSDLLVSDWMSVTLDVGSRSTWASTTTDNRALEAPDQSFLRAATVYSPSEVRLSVDFPSGYTGDLHVYSVDWEGVNRRQTVTVDDGNGPQTVALDTDFEAGAWMHFTVNVAPGGTATVSAVNNGPFSAVISGVFLGNDTYTGPPPPPPPPPPGAGEWVGLYGADGYALGAWNRRTDLVSPGFPDIDIANGRRARWASSTTDDRALEAPDQSFLRAATWYQKHQLNMTLTFADAYSGPLHAYAVDWEGVGRRQTVTVDDGNGPQTVALDTDFDAGAWMHFTIDVPAGGTVTVTAAKTAGVNAVISGLFLGD